MPSASGTQYTASKEVLPCHQPQVQSTLHLMQLIIIIIIIVGVSMARTGWTLPP